VLKEEPDDLTYLAPIAGDSCIPLDLPSVSFSADLFDSVVLTPEMLDCIPLTAFEFPILPYLDSVPVLDAEEPTLKTESNENDVPESPEATDPFLFLNFRTAPASQSSTDTSSSEVIFTIILESFIIQYYLMPQSNYRKENMLVTK
jgi:hypothetical protein